jgi:predicted RND superfamily exporter protein
VGNVVARLLDLVIDRARWTLALSLAAAVLSVLTLVDFSEGRLRLQIDPSSEVLFPEGSEARAIFDRSRRMLGSDDPLVVALGFEDVFAKESLERVAALTRAIEEVDGVARVVSLATAPSIRSQDGDIAIASFMEQLPESAAQREALADEVLANPLFRGVLASPDRSTTALLVYLDEMPDQDFVRAGIDPRIVSLARELGGDEVWVSGFPHFKATMSTSLQRTLALALPLILLFLVATLALAFRNVRGVLVPIATIALALLCTLALIVALGGSLNVITTIVPPLILTLGFSYTIHVLYEYTALLRLHAAAGHGSPLEIVREALHEVAMPVVTTGVTTAAGFVALAITPIPAIREFGIYSLWGVLVTVVASLTFTPAVLALLPVPKSVSAERTGRLHRMGDALARFAIRRRKVVIGAAVAASIAALIGASQIVVASHFITAFQEDAPVRMEFEAINDRLGGANAIQILVEGPVRNSLLDPELMQALHDFQLWLERDPAVGRVTSFVDYLMLLNRALHDDDPAYYRVPERARLASQLLLLGASDEAERMLDAEARVANLTVMSKVSDSGQVSELVDRISERLAELPGGVESQVTGNMVLVSDSVNAAARSQWQSLTVAFGIIFLVLALLFMSFRVAFVALLPNALPIAAYFGALGFTGITLNTSTALVGCLTLGIAVDDTIHYFARFSREARRLGDELAASRSTLRGLIHPVTFTSAGLCFGFLVLTTTELRPQIEFGALASFTLAFAWLVDVTLSPALCGGLKIVTLWDLLTLDLGEEPHRSIPLFEGLSKNQARVFTLLSDLRELEAGEPLMRVGDPAEDIFVVVDGTLVAWIERDGRRIDLSKMKRGDTIGEIGHFSRFRSANVDAVERARLVRFEPRDLDQMVRRRPRIAACVYRNLNRIQAERLTRTTERIG